ncbi:MAG: cardiolipin synthase [Oscillospiraceae bacterium]|nr:cardiolipin synthase [Oscillospiraceae bacterium]
MRLIKRVFGVAFSRLFLVGAMLALQIGIAVTAMLYFRQFLFHIYIPMYLISFIFVIAIVNNGTNPVYKITWIIAIFGFPLAGGLFYLFFGATRLPRKLVRRLAKQDDILDHMTEPAGGELSPALRMQESYIRNVTGFPACANTQAEYYALGEHMFDAMIRELKQAQRYIFIEFFIIRPGKMWDSIFAILQEKVKDGVKAYVMYDDIGSIKTMPKGYDKKIRAAGISLCVFNPFRPRLSPMLNYRDHRKIMVVDGKTAFCGGINLADEYINQLERFGHWRDTGVMLRGGAAWQFALLFLQQWQFGTQSNIDIAQFIPRYELPRGDGLVQVLGDSPLDSDNVTESAYHNIISRAAKYVYITTPYLVIDYNMEQALCTAAQSGIDVRIVTPYRYDKWYVHALTRSHYKRLILSGVKIYEYTPGFIHSKMFVSDDSICMVGTCNMDFRSFYLHFECSVAFYNSSVIRKVKEDILDCQKLSHAVTRVEASDVSAPTKVLRAMLKLFAPLM